MKNSFLGATKIVKNIYKSKNEYNCCGMAFDGAGLWRFGNGFANNIVVFDVDHRKNNCIVLDKGYTDDINGGVSVTEKKFSIKFSKAKGKFYLRLHYNGDSSYMFVNRKTLTSLKLITKM